MGISTFPLQDTQVIISKTYDGNKTATVIAPGTLTGVAPGDQVIVGALATYDTANAGSNKTITVKYTLSGRDAARYSAPADKTITTGVVTKKQLTITSPTITKSKAYDGTTTASVSAGTLDGKVGTDNVSVQATGVYNDASVGTGKTITVNYTLNGTDAGNYSAPVSSSVNDGVITALPSTITFASSGPIAKAFGDAPFTNNVTGGNGAGAITYTSGTTSVATVNQSTGEVTPVGVGTTVITATKAATATHAAVTATYTVNVSAAQAVAGPVEATTGQSTILYTLTTGTFGELSGNVPNNWTIAGADAAELGAITGVVLSNDNKTATISVTSPIGANTQIYTVAPTQLAMTAGYTAPAAKAVTINP